MMQSSAVVIGSGPNGLSAAIVLARAGFSVEVREAASEPGGGTRSGELTLPGFVHDYGSAVHPMAVSSPFFAELPLAEHGLKWIWPPASVAHPLDDGTAVMLERDVATTAAQLGEDRTTYKKLFHPLVSRWPTLAREFLRPFARVTRHPFLVARFGVNALLPATVFTRIAFQNPRTRALFAGWAAHSELTLESLLTCAFGLIFGISGHAAGWPVPQGGSQQIANALIGVLKSYGGRIATTSRVASLRELGQPDITMCDVSPHQFLQLAGRALPHSYARCLQRYRQGPGVYKIDWALREPIPWKPKECARSATVHVGGTLEEIAASERAAWSDRPSERPFILLAQPSLFDPTRAPSGHHTAWAYCHVPNGWREPMLTQMENQIERFAPGFRDCILARVVHNPEQMQAWNENLIGGDISGGAPTLKQFVLRPTWRRYRTPLRGVYFCSSSTPPGGGVHGMCGYWAAQWAISDFRAAHAR
jgi:phytoene dehydrogenase-like protein